MFENFTQLQLQLLRNGLATQISEFEQEMSREELQEAKGMIEALDARLSV